MAIQSNFPSIRPSLLLDFANSKRLDPRVTFTRASTATYYDGVTVSKAEENLFQQSQAFDNVYWTKDNSTVTADTTTAPDGTSTADSFSTANASNIRKNIRRDIVPFISLGTVGTFSVFAKADTVTIIQIYNSGDVQAFANFDLSAGTVGTAGTKTTASIVSFGSGWYRCIVTFDATTTYPTLSDFRVQLQGSSTDGWAATSTVTGNVFIWGAQAELRSAVTAYTATTTQAITNYVPRLLTAAANVARFDHTPTTGASLGLLVEESRQNLSFYSDDFANAYWAKDASSITSNTIVAPDGTLTGDKLVEDATTAVHAVRTSTGFTVSTNTTYTWSVYLKAGERTIAKVLDNNELGATFDLSAGTITATDAATTATITAVGNGWYRCAISRGTLTATTTRLRVYLVSTGTTTSYAGNGYSGLYVWGGQVEVGAFATSYIPTVAAAVTRSADAASMTGTNFSSWYNASEGTMYLESTNAGGIVAGTFTLTDSQASVNRLFVQNDTRTNVFAAVITTNSASQVSVTLPGVAVGALGKIAMAYKTNDVAAVVNAGTVQTDTSVVLPVVDRMHLGTAVGNSAAAASSGWVRKLAYYPLRVSNANLVAITG